MNHFNTFPVYKAGFTLVEISIVMIIIGLLIGGIFGGMKLIDNANVQKSIQDIKAIESASLTFRDTYRALPGYIRTPSTRIPNCTAAPCATGGNGDRIVGVFNGFGAAISATSENFLFWHHLQASDIINLNTQNTTSLQFGEGQPSGPLAGYRVSDFNAAWIDPNYTIRNTILFINDMPSQLMDGGGAMTWAVSCSSIENMDRKMDDGIPYNGKLKGWACVMPAAPNVPYQQGLLGAVIYDLQGF